MGVKLLGKIPFDPVFIQSMAVGKNIFEYVDSSATLDAVQAVWEEAESFQPAVTKRIIL
jgi:hypothetical protein